MYVFKCGGVCVYIGMHVLGKAVPPLSSRLEAHTTIFLGQVKLDDIQSKAALV